MRVSAGPACVVLRRLDDPMYKRIDLAAGIPLLCDSYQCEMLGHVALVDGFCSDATYAGQGIHGYKAIWSWGTRFSDICKQLVKRTVLKSSFHCNKNM